MKAQIGIIVLAVAILAAAVILAFAMRFQPVKGEMLDKSFDRWTGKYHYLR